ncbi:MAG TPA: hypothetical protein VHB50_11575, partial [Bryobacteraceae bacterium]|nr:hypothetical protein [Bryobacteraceae bacterium]
YIRRTLMFPYDDGEKFQQALFLKEGKNAFAEVFREPPVSTSQVIHPDRYFNKVKPTEPELPKPIRRAKPFVNGTLGELDETILLRQYVNEQAAGELSPRLKGATYRIDEAKPDHRMMLVYVSEWQDEDSASRYFDAYQKVMQGKWKNVEFTSRKPNHIAGKCADGYFALTRQGTRVTSQEGFAQPL